MIPLDLWVALDDMGSAPVGELALAVDVSPDRAWSAVSVAGRRADGLLHVELVEHHPGTEWVAPRVAELVGRHGPRVVAVDFAGPAGSLKVALEERRLPLRAVSAQEHAQACGQFYDVVHQRAVRHLPQAQLVSALDGAAKRPLGDAWAWSRKSSSVDICPLVSCTLAAWALDASPSAVDPLEALW